MKVAESDGVVYVTDKGILQGYDARRHELFDFGGPRSPSETSSLGTAPERLSVELWELSEA